MAILDDLNALMKLRSDLAKTSRNRRAIEIAENISIRLSKDYNMVFRLVFNGDEIFKITESGRGSPLKVVAKDDLDVIARGWPEEPLNLIGFSTELVKENFEFYRREDWKQDTHAPRGQDAFGNRDNLLKNGTYREYDILRRSGSGKRQLNPRGFRGLLRFVRNVNNGRVYFTYDHYRCFVLVSSDGNKYLK